MVRAASCPPLQKTQGRGTHSFGTGSRKTERVGHPPIAGHPVTFSVDNYLGTGSYGTYSLYFAVERLI
jgi:hypothetical protein